MPALVLPYQPKVQRHWATPKPALVVEFAARQTQSLAAPNAPTPGELSERLVEMDHCSPLEHAIICFYISDISRGVANQLVRHRIGSFTQSSTHYVDHSSARHFVDPCLVRQSQDAIDIAQGCYTLMEPKSEARQIMPISTETSLVWTVNARSLLNFLRQRLCKRNMKEMRLLALAVLWEAKRWYNEVFNTIYALPDCARVEGCRQGKMSCGAPWIK